MKPFEAVCLALLVSSATASWLRREAVATSDGREVDDSCLALADEGSCEFYSCFERRLPCGRDWYMLRHGAYYCNKMERERPNFSETGQMFLDDARACMTQSLKQFYSREYMNCHSLEHEAIASLTSCFVDNAFCDVFRTDSQHFFQVFEVQDLFSRGAGKIWRAMLNLGARCGSETVRDFASESGDTVVGALNNFFSRISGAIGKK